MLKTHEAVRDAVAVGLPDEKFGEAITAVVELVPGAELDEARHRRPREGQAGRLQGPEAGAADRHHRPRPQRQGRLQAPQGLGRRPARRGALTWSTRARSGAAGPAPAGLPPRARRHRPEGHPPVRAGVRGAWRPPTRRSSPTTAMRWPRSGPARPPSTSSWSSSRRTSSGCSCSSRPSPASSGTPRRSSGSSPSSSARATSPSTSPSGPAPGWSPSSAPPPAGCSSGWAPVAIELWQAAADAFADRDPAAGARLEAADDELDDLHTALTTELLGRAGSPPAAAADATLVARFYERLGDHAVHIATRVVRRRLADPRTRSGGGPGMTVPMRTTNPALTEKAFEDAAGWAAGVEQLEEAYSQPAYRPPIERTDVMTVNGTVWATAALLVLVVAAGVFGWNSVDSTADAVSLPGWLLPVAPRRPRRRHPHDLQARPGPVHLAGLRAPRGRLPGGHLGRLQRRLRRHRASRPWG